MKEPGLDGRHRDKNPPKAGEIQQNEATHWTRILLGPSHNSHQMRPWDTCAERPAKSTKKECVAKLAESGRRNKESKPMPSSETGETALYRILCLDGGGAKGFYTLGALQEIEAMLGAPLYKMFDLIYGTSTGSVIAALLALGMKVPEIHELYKEHVPRVMEKRWRSGKSKALGKVADKIFGNRKFEAALTGIGIVATNWRLEKPMIFKNQLSRAHGSTGSFVPGFGCTFSEVVQASCSAYPIFNRKTIETAQGDRVVLVDGGYCANNPALYAIADAVVALRKDPSDIRVLSVGVGVYPKPRSFLRRVQNEWLPKYVARVDAELVQKTLEINTQSMEQLRSILFRNIQTVRVSEEFSIPEMATDFTEHNLKKLNLLRQRGKRSFGDKEAQLKQLLL